MPHSNDHTPAPNGTTPEREAVDAGVVGRNLARFGRRLRDAGIPAGPGQVINLMNALESVSLDRREDVYFASRAVLITRPEQIPAFNVEFDRFWNDLLARTPRLFEPVLGEDEESVGSPDRKKSDEKEDGGQGESGSSSEKTMLAIEGDDSSDSSDAEDFEAPPEDVMIFSASEALRKKEDRKSVV